MIHTQSRDVFGMHSVTSCCTVDAHDRVSYLPFLLRAAPPPSYNLRSREQESVSVFGDIHVHHAYVQLEASHQQPIYHTPNI